MTTVLAAVGGVLLFLLRIQLPAPVQDAVDSISSMVGPMGMLILSMLIAEMDLKKLLSYHRLWWITLLRLVGIPLIGIVLLKYSSRPSTRKMRMLLLPVQYCISAAKDALLR